MKMMMVEPYYLFVSIMMGLIGFAAFRYGRQNGSAKHIVLAALFTFLPYFLVDAKYLAMSGGALVILLFWP